MICTLRHLIFRTWATLLAGGLMCLLILPAIHSRVGLEWEVLPAVLIFFAVFGLIGWASNRVGTNAVERIVEDAAKWERAGLLRSAENTYKRALAVLDSFLLSPLAKRRELASLSARIARFYLARADKTKESEAFIISYLHAHPEDGEVAEEWLRQVKMLGEHERNYYELASRIGDAQADNINVQYLLARLYAAAQRTDYPALQTYRQVLARGDALAADIVRDVAVLFIREGRADEWALSVYLWALRQGGEREFLMKGLAACVHWIAENERTRKHLQEARKVLKGFDEIRLENMRTGFNPPTVEPGLLGVPSRREITETLSRASIHIGIALMRVKSFTFIIWTETKRLVRGIIRSKKTKPVLRWSMITVLLVAVGILVFSTVSHLIKTRKGVPEKKEIAEVVINDPFTIQVAAYLKPEDAQVYTSYLKKRGLDAYWRKKEGTKKTYYQVRVSHFSDKASAKAYGASLRRQGIIEDFYVANYGRP